MLELLIATKNTGKIREIEKLLADLPIAVRSLKEFGNVVEPEEIGADFAENAVLKARYYAGKTGLSALADDSGLEVEALGGAPGVFSARYAGIIASDEEKIFKLLDELEQTSDDERRARFVCVIAIADKNGEIRCLEEGICRGKIARKPTGANGFGYDPIFIPDGFSETFGGLSDEIKQKISHRARAALKIIGFLRDFIVV